MYADKVTGSMQSCIDETERRRTIQTEYNREHGITPQTVKKGMRSILESIEEHDYTTLPKVAEGAEEYVPLEKIPGMLKKLRKEMLEAAEELAFERAAELRDRIRKLQELELAVR